MKDLQLELTRTVPISYFNKGMAGKIFKDVRETGSKVVMKNNVPECVLLSPEEYLKLIEERNKRREAAVKRLMDDLRVAEAEDAQYGGLTEEELAKELGVTL
ncbi:MAG: type II toxin-antitoxin system Phd/YefM family antitoxin [Acidaminococcaceae bacterium]|nr:type II toxin-antitoxin system Phd/YefM family antitoxin [Acidaminococcaceae bacterium]